MVQRKESDMLLKADAYIRRRIEKMTYTQRYLFGVTVQGAVIAIIIAIGLLLEQPWIGR